MGLADRRRDLVAAAVLVAVFIVVHLAGMAVMAVLVMHASGETALELMVSSAPGEPRLLFPALSAIAATSVTLLLWRAGLTGAPPDDGPPSEGYVWELAGITIAITGDSVRCLRRPDLDGLYDHITALRDQGRELLWSNRGPLLVAITAITIFSVHLWMLLRYSIPHLGEDAVYVVVDPFRVVLSDGLIEGIENRWFQINSYTGNPFVFLPLMLLLGFTPGGLQLIEFMAFAASSVIIFLLFRRMFGFMQAVVGILILFSMQRWLVYSYVIDYIYSILFVVVLLYLYYGWRDEGFDPCSLRLYAMASLGGVFLAAKSTTAYALLIIAVGTIYSGGRSTVREVITDRNMVALLLLFLVGVSPLLAWNGAHLDELRHDLFVELGQSVDRGLEDSVKTRLQHLNFYIGGEWGPIRTPLRETAFRPLVTFGIDMGDGYGSLGLVTLLTLLTVPYLLLRRKNVHLVLLSVTLFILFLLVPGSMDYGHIMPLLPLVAGLIVAALDTLPGRLRWIIPVIAIVLAGGLIAPPLLQSVPDRERRSVQPEAYGGSMPVYTDMKALDLDRPLVTNAFRPHVSAKYLLQVPRSHFLLPRGMTYEVAKQLPKSAGGEMPATLRYSFSLAALDFFWRGPKLQAPSMTFLLYEQMPCTPWKEFCGASTQAVLDRFNITRQRTETVSLGGRDYLIIRGVEEPWGHETDIRLGGNYTVGFPDS